MEFPRTRYLQMLQLRKENGLIKVITGMRRAGKSFLMNELLYAELVRQSVDPSQIILFAFDSDEDLDLLDPYYPDEPVRKRQTCSFG